MSVTITNIISNINQSVFYWFNNASYTKGSTVGSLRDHFDGLNIKLGFPSALDKLSLPALTIELEPVLEQDDEVFGQYTQQIVFPFTIYGFSGAHDQDGDNRYTRDALKNDVRFLLQKSDYLNVYDFPADGSPDFDTVLTDVEITNVKSRDISPTGPNKVDRYRFIVEFAISYYWDIDLS